MRSVLEFSAPPLVKTRKSALACPSHLPIAVTPRRRIFRVGSYAISVLCVAFSLLLSDTALAQDKVAFYFAAHEDDWQLFMNPSAYFDVRSSATKVVFVYVTAGDAGAGTGNRGRLRPYYLARENGAKQSVIFMADAEKDPVVPSDSAPLFAGHFVRRWQYGNTVSFFLRLPDGDMDGTGYAHTGLQSLKRLREGAIDVLSAIDGSSAYRGWSDLTATLREVIVRERGQARTVWFHLPETDTTANAHDHSDHLLTGLAVLDASTDMPCINRALYLDYVSAMLGENLDTSDQQIKTATFTAVTLGINAFDHPGNWDSEHRALLSRTYVRTMPAMVMC